MIFNLLIWFDLNELECRPSLKSLQIFKMNGDDMTLCQCTWLSWPNTNPCHCPGHSLFQPRCQKNKLTWTISHIIKILVTFHNNASNIHVPGINFLEFLVHAIFNFLITSHHSWWWICKACLWKPYCICKKIPSVYLKRLLLVKKLCCCHMLSVRCVRLFQSKDLIDIFPVS